MHVLVVAEHDGKAPRAASRAALAFARLVAGQGGEGPARIEWLVLGHNVGEVARAASAEAPVVMADATALAHPVADRLARIIADVVKARGVDLLAAASTTFARDVVGRAAGLLGGAMASDVSGHEWRDGSLALRRPVYAGTLNATVTLRGRPMIITVRPSAYPPGPAPADSTEPHAIESWPVDETTLPSGTEYLGRESRVSGRPELTEARVVVCGGRAFKSAEEFESGVGGLADALGGAAGSTRSLVDAGITPNELQVGQTGKNVAPELYVALGLSGAIQHLAGVKNSKVIVAINTDPSAPIVEAADYALVADVRDAVPQLIEAVGGGGRAVETRPHA